MREKIFSSASWRAKHEDLKELGEAAALVGYLTMALKITPNLERACAFASEQLEGRMGQDLKRQMAECYLRFHSSADEALLKFSQRWGQSFPEFGQAIQLVRGSVAELSRSGRERSLDRALQL
ncbi:MAG: hypothetical protein ACP5PX_07350, partial [Candidatus Hadarchaeum sp.]|uniref:hypothetical protein n=1 Tax=Candidatus Hadarchaeum sp. TaxID=2883567 RepID=UPI003D1385EA